MGGTRLPIKDRKFLELNEVWALGSGTYPAQQSQHETHTEGVASSCKVFNAHYVYGLVAKLVNNPLSIRRCWQWCCLRFGRLSIN